MSRIRKWKNYKYSKYWKIHKVLKIILWAEEAVSLETHHQFQYLNVELHLFQFHRTNSVLPKIILWSGSNYISSARFLLTHPNYNFFRGIQANNTKYSKVNTYLRYVFIYVAFLFSWLPYSSGKLSSFLW